MNLNDQHARSDKLSLCAQRQRALSWNIAIFGPAFVAIAAVGGAALLYSVFSLKGAASDYERFTAQETSVKAWVSQRLENSEDLILNSDEAHVFKGVRVLSNNGAPQGTILPRVGGGVEFIAKDLKGNPRAHMGVDAEGRSFLYLFGGDSESSITFDVDSEGAAVRVSGGPEFPAVIVGTETLDSQAQSAAFLEVRHPDGTKLVESSTQEPGKLTLRRRGLGATHSIQAK